MPPFYEPGLEEALQDALQSGRIHFTTDVSEVRDSDVHFVGVGTPQKVGEYGADMQYVDAAIDSLLPYLKDGDLVVGKSTVPVGTAARIQGLFDVETDKDVTVVWNPEFLREGFAVQDTINPDRIVYGLPDGPRGERAKSIMDSVYEHALSNDTPRITTDYATAELVKVSANAFLATKISFINAISELVSVVGGDVRDLADAIGLDNRIGRKFLNAGVGFGGGCLPKDIRAFRARAEELGVGDSLHFLKEVDAINLRQRTRVLHLVTEALGGPVKVFGKKVAVLGLAFKPESDDIRDSPALDIAVQLKGLGADVYSTDPKAIANAQRKHPQLHYVESIDEALESADAIVVLTEWKSYRELEPEQVMTLVKKPVTVVDGRNVLDPDEWRSAGFNYVGIGIG